MRQSMLSNPAERTRRSSRGLSRLAERADVLDRERPDQWCREPCPVRPDEADLRDCWGAGTGVSRTCKKRWCACMLSSGVKGAEGRLAIR